jgi:predicted deacetylase
MIAPKDRALAVSIHDVSPWTRPATERMLADLAEAGVGVTSLLVVPDHHHRGAVDRDEDFLSWLRVLESSGHEVVLHGFFHRREPGPGSTWWGRLVTEHYTAGEGEFYDLAYAEARRRMARGRVMLEGAGLAVRGFIAPAWLLGAEAERAARDEAFDYTTRLGGLLDLRTDAWTPSQSLVYSVRSGWRRAVSLIWNASLAARLRGNPLARLGLHPPDWNHEPVRSQALRLARGMASGRRVIRYRDAVGDPPQVPRTS